ncbi:MAG TPA: CpaD family pilus assembly protein [Beijerinckiaceae bacterium]|nr:CpaD family pilus assembly protein [Beijerinckiaceae bacterium]
MTSPAQKRFVLRPGAMMGRWALVVLAGLAAAGCVRRPVEVQAQIPDAYQERHPIVLGDVQAKLDVFLAANGGLGYRQAGDVKDFVQQYSRQGKGALVATLPAGAPGGSVRHTLGEIRKIAAANGVKPGAIQVRSGGETHPTAASVRLTFARLDARVVSKCGQWPHDLAGGSTLQSWENRPYYNFGCGYQTMLAAQVADPVDMIRGRPESPIDIEKRLGDLESVRENSDPTTKWPSDQTKINSAL